LVQGVPWRVATIVLGVISNGRVDRRINLASARAAVDCYLNGGRHHMADDSRTVSSRATMTLCAQVEAVRIAHGRDRSIDGKERRSSSP
jgi:hypothetical protein